MYIVHIAISVVLRDSPKHLGKVLGPSAEISPTEFSKLWKSTKKKFRKTSYILGFSAFFMATIRTMLFPAQTNLLVFINTFAASWLLFATYHCFVPFLELMTEGHAFQIKKPERDIIGILTLTEETYKSDVNSIISKHEALGDRGLCVQCNDTSIGDWMWRLTVAAYENADVAPIWKARVFMCTGCTFIFLRLFIRHVMLVAKVGDAYHELVDNFSSAKSFHMSHHIFGDQGALKDLFESNEMFKSHAWVLFAHPVDMTLVWAVLTSAGLAIVLTLGSTM